MIAADDSILHFFSVASISGEHRAVNELRNKLSELIRGPINTFAKMEAWRRRRARLMPEIKYAADAAGPYLISRSHLDAHSRSCLEIGEGIANRIRLIRFAIR